MYLLALLWLLQQCLGNRTPLHRQFGAHNVTDDSTELAGWKIVREMVRHIWPRDRPDLKLRVVGALGLLVSAKVTMATAMTYNLLHCYMPSVANGNSTILVQVDSGSS